MTEKLVLIACDNLASISSVMHCLRSISSFQVNIISSTRVSDAVQITRSLNPAVVIFGFKNSTRALKDFNLSVNNLDIPIICLKHNDEQLLINPNRIFFTHPIEHLGNGESISLTVRSILHLKEYPSLNNTNHSINRQLELQRTESHRTLSKYVMEIDQKTKLLTSIKNRVSELFPFVDDPTRVELIAIANSIKLGANSDKMWNDFALHYEKIDPGFISSLSKKHPTLTTQDLKYCCYLKMNLSNDDIRNLLGINQESVRTHKYRLKKKLFLPKEQKLGLYVHSFGESNRIQRS